MTGAKKKRKSSLDATEDFARKKQAPAGAPSGSTNSVQDPNHMRPARINRGGGGPAKKFEAFDKAVELSKRHKASGVPTSEPLNPMAPTTMKRKAGRTNAAAKVGPNTLLSYKG
jgi:hypothetical protein